MSTHNPCFIAKIRKKCKPQFYYIKVGCKGVYFTRPCYHDASEHAAYFHVQAKIVRVRFCFLHKTKLKNAGLDAEYEVLGEV